MENYGKETGKDEASVQWHTLSENLMDLGSENSEPPKEASDSPLPQGKIQPQEEKPEGKPIANPFAHPEQQEPMGGEKMPSGKKKKPIWAIVAAVLVLLIVSGAAVFYFTVHRWTEPTCTEASVCTICGKQSSPAAGHQWIPATCTAAKTCSVCRETEGTLEHDLKDAASYNYVKCTKESWKECSRCDYRTSSQSGQLTSFLDDTKEFFRMSPNEFKERVEYLASQFNPTECSGVDYLPHDDLKNAIFWWDSGSGSQDSSTSGLPVLYCYAGSGGMVALVFYDLNKDEIEEFDFYRDRPSSFNCVMMKAMNGSQETAAVYHSMELILLAACDPEVNIYDLGGAALAGAANSGRGTENNDLIYGANYSSYNIVTRKMVDKLRNRDS